MLLAASTLVLSLLQQIEMASYAEPPVFQVQTLLSTAELLPLDAYAKQRRRFIDGALRANTAIRHDPSRYGFRATAARLLAKHVLREARRLCREISARHASGCWSSVDPIEGLRSGVFPDASILPLVEKDAALLGRLMAAFPEKASRGDAQVLADAAKIASATNAALAAEALEKVAQARRELSAKPEVESPKRPPLDPAIKRKFDRAENRDTPAAEKSELYHEILDVSGTIQDIDEQLSAQGIIAAWFAANGEEATAARAAAMLHKTFADTCHCEDARCDSIEGRAECSDNIDTFVEFLADNKIDPEILRIPHPSFHARTLLRKLKDALQ